MKEKKGVLMLIRTINGFYVPIKPTQHGAYTWEEVTHKLPEGVEIKVYEEVK